MILRPAEREDVAYIRSLELDPDYRPYISVDTENTHLEHIQDECISLGIYEVENTPVGFLLGLYNPTIGVYELRRIAIEKRGKGLGKRALCLAFHDAFENYGAQRLWLDVYEHNPVAIGLYRSMGMVHEGILRRSDKKEGKLSNQWIFSLLKEEYLSRLDGYRNLCNN